MDITGLEYRTFAELRELVIEERHRKWLEFAGNSKMKYDKLVAKQKKMYADMNLESPFGTWNVILAKMDEAEASLQAELNKNKD